MTKNTFPWIYFCCFQIEMNDISWLGNTWHARLTLGEWRQNLGVTPLSPSSMQVFLLLHSSATRFYQEFFHKKCLPQIHVIILLRSRCWRPFWPGKAQGGIRFSSFVSISNFQFLGHDMDVSDYDGRTPLHLAAAEVKYQQSAYYMEKMNTYLRGTRSASRFSCTSVMSTLNPQTGNKWLSIAWTK